MNTTPPSTPPPTPTTDDDQTQTQTPTLITHSTTQQPSPNEGEDVDIIIGSDSTKKNKALPSKTAMIKHRHFVLHLLLLASTIFITGVYQQSDNIFHHSKELGIRAYTAEFGSIIVAPVTKVDDSKKESDTLTEKCKCLQDVTLSRQRTFPTPSINTWGPPNLITMLPSKNNPVPTYTESSTAGKLMNGLGKVVWVDMAEGPACQIFDPKAKPTEDFNLEKRLMTSHSRAVIYHCMETDKSGYCRFSAKSFCNRYSIDIEKCLRGEAVEGDKMCIIVHYLDHTFMEDRAPIDNYYTGSEVAELNLGIDFSITVDDAVKKEKAMGGLSYHYLTVLHIKNNPSQDSIFHGGHKIEGLQRLHYGLSVEAGYQVGAKDYQDGGSHYGTRLEMFFSGLLGGYVLPTLDAIDSSIVKHLEKLEAIICTKEDETPDSVEEVTFLHIGDRDSWATDYDLTTPASDVMNEERDMKVDPDEDDTTCPTEESDNEEPKLQIATHTMFDLRFGRNSKLKEISLLGGKVKRRKWQDLLPGNADVNNPEVLYDEKGCETACNNLKEDVKLLQTTHGDPYFTVPFAGFNTNNLFFKKCECASSVASNMVDYLQAYGYKVYQAFGELVYMTYENEDCQVSDAKVYRPQHLPLNSYPMFGKGTRPRFGHSEIERDLHVSGEIAYMITLDKAFEKGNIKTAVPPKANRSMFGTPLPGSSFRAYLYTNVHMTSMSSAKLGKAHMIPREWDVKVMESDTLNAHKSFSKAEQTSRLTKDWYIRERIQTCYTKMHNDNVAKFAKWAVVSIMGKDGKARTISNTRSIINNLEQQFAPALIELIRKTHEKLRTALVKKNN